MLNALTHPSMSPDDRLAGSSGLKTIKDHQKQRRQHEEADDDEQADHRQRWQRQLSPGKKRSPLEGPHLAQGLGFFTHDAVRPLTLLYEAVYAASIVVGGSIVIHIRRDAFFAELRFIGRAYRRIFIVVFDQRAALLH